MNIILYNGENSLIIYLNVNFIFLIASNIMLKIINEII